jgi:hypothetical protein
MISARPADSRRRLLTLRYPAISAETPEPRRLRGGQRPVFLAPVFGTRNLALLALLRGKIAFRRSTGGCSAEQISLAACGLTLRARWLVTTKRRDRLLGSDFDPRA